MKNILIALFLVSTAFAEKTETIGKLESFQGKISIEFGGKKETPKKSMLLRAGENISTEKDSMARVILNNGQILNIGEKSNITLKNEQSGTAGEKTTLLMINEGTVRGIVSKAGKTQGKYKLKLKTPSATMGVRGTEFIVSHQDDKTGSSFVSLDDTFDVSKSAGPNGELLKPQFVSIGEYTKVKDKILSPVEIEGSQFRSLKGNDVNGRKTNEMMNPDTGRVSTINVNTPVGLQAVPQEPLGMLNNKNEYVPPPPKGYEIKNGRIEKDHTAQVIVDLQKGTFIPVASTTGEYEGRLYEALSKNEGYKKALNEENNTRMEEQKMTMELMDAKLNKDQKKAERLEMKMTELKLKINSLEKSKAELKKEAIVKEVVPALKKETGDQRVKDAGNNNEVQKAMLNVKMAETEAKKNELENKRITAIQRGDQKEIRKTEENLKSNEKSMERNRNDYMKVEGAIMSQKFSDINTRFGEFMENKGEARIAIKNEMNGQMMLAKIDLDKYSDSQGRDHGRDGSDSRGMGPGYMPPPEIMGRMMHMNDSGMDPKININYGDRGMGPYNRIGLPDPGRWPGDQGPDKIYGPSSEMMEKMKAFCETNPSDKMCMMMMGPEGADRDRDETGPWPSDGPYDPEICRLNPSACGPVDGGGGCMPGDPYCMMKPPWCQENPNAPECMGPEHLMDEANCALEPWRPECRSGVDNLCILNPSDPICIGSTGGSVFGDVPRTDVTIRVRKL